jgi:hypothetical protein
MPALEYRPGSQRFGNADTTVAEVRLKAGELALAMRGADTLWSQPPRTIGGTVLAAGTGEPVPGARVSLLGTTLEATTDGRGRFSLTGVLAGEYTVDVRTPSLDSIGAGFPATVTVTESIAELELRAPTGAQVLLAACRKARLDPPGIVVGTVSLPSEGARPHDMKVLAEWIETTGQPVVPAMRVDRQSRWLQTTVDSAGGFRLCGLPIDTDVTIRAESDSFASNTVEARIAPGSRFARAALLLTRGASRAAVFAGRVADSSGHPIGNAEVSLPELSKGALSNDAGEFRLANIPAGTHRIHVRRLGYGPLDTVVAFRPNQVVDRHIILGDVVALDSVRVTAEATALPLSFEEHRRTGLGTFMTREQLAPRDGAKLAEVLSELPSASVYRGSRGAATVGSIRRAPSLQRGAEIIDSLPGIGAKCVAKVYVDGHLMNPGSTAEPFNVNTVSPERIEAIEWYAGPSQTPWRYSNLNSVCGVLVIWLRR